MSSEVQQVGALWMPGSFRMTLSSLNLPCHHSCLCNVCCPVSRRLGGDWGAWGAQVVGFFVVEDRVQRGAAGLAAGPALDAGWESACAALKAPLDAAFEALPAAAPMLALKNFVALACTALGAPSRQLRVRGSGGEDTESFGRPHSCCTAPMNSSAHEE